jgi:cytosine/adenosine deaminase-related metal-dependent hydrolase
LPRATERVLVKNAFIVTMDEQRRVFEKGYIVVNGETIEKLGKGSPKHIKADRVIDATGQVAIPGLVCTHTHMYGVLSHGMPLNNPPTTFYGFLKDFWWPRVEDKLGTREITASTRMACVQMARSGTTTFADILEAPNSLPGALDAEADIVRKAGLRGVLSFEATERAGESIAEHSLNENVHFIQNWNHRHELVRGMMCTHTLFTCSTTFLQKARELASRLRVGIHIHLEEGRYETDYSTEKYGKLPVEVYESIGFLSNDILASQCVHTRPLEIAIMKKHGVKVSHMPLSNCEVGGGIAPLYDFLNAELTVGLGTDGYVTDMFEVMRAAFLIHKGKLQNASVIPATVAFEMATIGGARVLRMENETGSLKVGKQADLVLLNLTLPTPLTPQNIYDQIVAFGTGSSVETVIVSGAVIVDNGKTTGVREQEAKEVCAKVARELWSYAN